MLQRIERIRTASRAPLWLGLAAVVLSLPALRFGLQNDDYALAREVAQGAPPWDLFDFRKGISPLVEQGAAVWWANPGAGTHFFRPLASSLHALEFTYWPDAPWLMLLLNALVYGVCVALAAQLYRQLAPSAASAGLAALLFASDPSHAFSVGWIASRNTLLAMAFSLAALLAHVHARTRAGAWWPVASLASLALALASSEAGVWSLAFLLSYALVLESGPLAARLRTIAPQLALGTTWATAYVALGYGAQGASYYRDLTAPFEVLLAGALDLPLWATSLLGPGGVASALFLPENQARLAVLPVAGFAAWLTLPALRTSKECRFFALAALLALAPLLLTLPNPRVLLGPNLGVLGWVGCAIASGRKHDGRLDWRGALLLGVHLTLGALFPFALGGMQAFQRGTRALASVLTDSDVVLVRSPVELLGPFTLLSRERDGLPVPRTLHQLYVGGSELTIERPDLHVLELIAPRGWGYAPLERLSCRREDMPRTGSQRQLPGGVLVRVLESTLEGLPRRVRFIFPTPLEAPGRQWLIWQEGGPEAFSPPPVGERVRIRPLAFHRALP